MPVLIKSVFFFLVLLNSIRFVPLQGQECYLLMLGKECSENGKVLLAHNNELGGKEASMLRIVPVSEEIDILPENNYPFSETSAMLILQTNKGFAEGDAVAINKHGVAIAGGLSLKTDRNSKARKIDPLVPTGLGGGVRYLALQHSKTAKECVELMGKLYTKFGIKYPSAAGIADSNEVWYIEAGGGSSWAAVRIPDDKYIAAANSYRIARIDFNDTINYISSPGLKDFCIESGLWNGKDDFNFSLIFGGGRKESSGSNLYNSLRVWRAFNLLNPGLKIPDNQEYFPMFQKPEKKISLEKLFSILRDHYNNTPYDVWTKENTDNPKRAIADWNCVHTSVISIEPGVPPDYGSVIWTGLSTPYSAVYIPVYLGINDLPPDYEYAPEKPDRKSAFWQFKTLGDSLRSNYPDNASDWLIKRKRSESIFIKENEIIIKKATELYDENPDNGRKYLRDQTAYFAQKALQLINR